MTDEQVELLVKITQAIEAQPAKPDYHDYEYGKCSKADYEDQYYKWAAVDNFVTAITQYDLMKNGRL
ncbi:hypothetical protein KGP40_02800 [Weissella cibaria]|uniref:hypothetical protein n=1 Tax=Weissella cibaria TaxID=137591 RepID=UPI001C1FE95F|nr:hypothetical protein [Weissella cibaria]MBU7560849.1 hypothetical protein [Weissella cibaria]